MILVYLGLWRALCAEEGEKYEYNGKTYQGESLKKLGIRIPLEHYDYQTFCMVFNKVK